MATDLCSAFNQYFDLLPADNDQLREEVFRLRYQVYVVETGFERAEDHPNGLERDAFDTRSDHYLLRHRATGVYAATARMILPDSSAPLAAFPIETHCQFHKGLEKRDPEERRRLGEVSRFAVSRAFKKRVGEAGTPIGISGNVEMYFEPDERQMCIRDRASSAFVGPRKRPTSSCRSLTFARPRQSTAPIGPLSLSASTNTVACVASATSGGRNSETPT